MASYPEISEYLAKAAAYHGHLCSGQVLGIRIVLKGLSLLGLKPGTKLRDLVAFIESDRCIADAVYVVAGLTVGKRRLKLLDYGKTAISFLDLATGKAWRVWVKTSKRPPHGLPRPEMLAYWQKLSDEEILGWAPVEITLPPEDLPGPPVRVATCARCGEDVLDAKDVTVNGEALCKACAQGAYYKSVETTL